MRLPMLSLILCAVLCGQAASTGNDLAVVGRIKTEAFESSQVMDTAEFLTDRYGPRLTASPEWREAADWAVKRLQGYGIDNVHLEKWGTPARSWSLKRASVEMLEPRYSALVAAPLAWSDVTHGAETAEVLLAPYGGGRRAVDPAQAQAELDKFVAQWKGKLKGKIILFTPLRLPEPISKPNFQRYTNQELTDLEEAPAPTVKVPVDLKDFKFPQSEDLETVIRFNASLPPAVREELRKRREVIAAKRAKFLKDEGVVAILQADQRAHDSLLFAEAAGPYDAKETMAPPTFVVTEEQYGRLVRLVDHKTQVRVRVELVADISHENQEADNIVAELPGSSKKDEVVMLGGHSIPGTRGQARLTMQQVVR